MTDLSVQEVSALVRHQVVRLIARIAQLLLWLAVGVFFVVCAFVVVKAFLLFRPTQPDLTEISTLSRIEFPKSAVLVESWYWRAPRREFFAVLRISGEDLAAFKKNGSLEWEWVEGTGGYTSGASSTPRNWITDNLGERANLRYWNPDAVEDYLVALGPAGTRGALAVLIDLDDPEEATVYIWDLIDH